MDGANVLDVFILMCMWVRACIKRAKFAVIADVNSNSSYVYLNVAMLAKNLSMVIGKNNLGIPFGFSYIFITDYILGIVPLWAFNQSFSYTDLLFK